MFVECYLPDKGIIHMHIYPAQLALIFILSTLLAWPVHAREKPRRPVEIRIDGLKQAITMIPIPAGTFTTSTDTRPLCGSNGLPSLTVEVAGFWLASTEVTFDLWDHCVAKGGCKHNPETPGWGRGQHPVEDISWDHTKEFLDWLSRETGKKFRLPTADEWEYAARAGMPLDKVPTAASDFKKVNFKEDSIRPPGKKTHANDESTVHVGSLPANPWGLHEMAGNLWEWTSDCGCGDDDPTTEGCNERILRGGSYTSSADKVTPISRLPIWPWFYAAFTGFRVAMD